MAWLKCIKLVGDCLWVICDLLYTKPSASKSEVLLTAHRAVLNVTTFRTWALYMKRLCRLRKEHITSSLRFNHVSLLYVRRENTFEGHGSAINNS